MDQTATNAQFIYDSTTDSYQCSGSWSIHDVNTVNTQLQRTTIPSSTAVTMNGQTITQFDSAGAVALMHCIDRFKANENDVKLTDFNQNQLDLLHLVEDKKEAIEYKPKPPKGHNLFYRIGKEAVRKLYQIDGLIILIGTLSEKLLLACGNWKRFQVTSVVSNINTTGIQALPILALLSFLIGVVLAYQMGIQLEAYGANAFIAYLSGIACFREFSPLITAIIVAGRTGSAFTAQIGNMKINEEIDALETMGLSSVELLVAPKVIALLIIFPLLIFWSDFFAIMGAMLMAKLSLNVPYSDFLFRISHSVGLKPVLLGLYKAPVFAMLIALVGCFQGFRVEFSSTSLGSQTTKSVVQALFLIIVADALFSIIYSWLDL